MTDKKYEIEETNIIGVSGFLDDWNLSPRFRITIGWIANIGFGQTDIQYDLKEKSFYIDSELMSREFVKAVLCKMVDDAVLDGEPENGR